MSAVATQKKKTGIKPPRHSSGMSLDETWRRLSNNIRGIFAQNLKNPSFEENHRFVYNLVHANQSEKVYEGVKALIIESLQKMVEERLVPAFPTAVRSDMVSRAKEGEELLKAFRYVWDDHESGLRKLRGILKYLDQVYPPAQRLPIIYDAGVTLFYKYIIAPPIEGHLVDAVLDEVRVERDGFAIDQSAVRGCVDVLSLLQENSQSLTVYQEKLEPPLLDESRRYYEAEGKQKLEFTSAPEYLTHVDKRFTEETPCAKRYLNPKITPLLKEILEDTLLTPHLATVIYMPNSGMDSMIDTNNIQSLTLMYKLFKRVATGIPSIREAYKESIILRGRKINLNGELDVVEDPVGGEGGSKGKGKARPRATGTQTLQQALKWVQDVLDLNDKFYRVWSEAFNSDQGLETAMVKGFEGFINVNPKAPEFISLFINENLKGVEDRTDLEVDVALDKTINVFRYLTDKHGFECYYKGHLAKRLLLGQSVSDDAERQMLGKLKVECSHQFRKKLEGMFNDMVLSTETMEGYRGHLARTTAPSVAITVTIMTSTYWPSAADVPCTLPEVLVKAAKSFEVYYLAKHTGRRLIWRPSMGTAEVRVQFKSREHDLTVSTIALVILLLFEDLEEDDSLTYEEIKTTTSIPDNELSRNLQSLACAKYNILKKHPPGRDVNHEDSFSFNNDFTSDLQKIKISTVSSEVETTEEREEMDDRIDEERRYQTEACIIRIMRDRRHMVHNDLVNEVTRQLIPRFHPNPIDIKGRIECLIEQEHLVRCGCGDSYSYLG